MPPVEKCRCTTCTFWFPSVSLQRAIMWHMLRNSFGARTNLSSQQQPPGIRKVIIDKTTTSRPFINSKLLLWGLLLSPWGKATLIRHKKCICLCGYHSWFATSRQGRQHKTLEEQWCRTHNTARNHQLMPSAWFTFALSPSHIIFQELTLKALDSWFVKYDSYYEFPLLINGPETLKTVLLFSKKRHGHWPLQLHGCVHIHPYPGYPLGSHMAGLPTSLVTMVVISPQGLCHHLAQRVKHQLSQG